MAVTINASTSAGLVQSADLSGAINIQSNGTTVLGVTSTGASITGTQSVSGNLSFNSGYGSSAVAYGCRAWVNFDGTTNTGGFCTIRGSGNVTSVADNGTGDYTVNFTNAMPDTNYVITGSARVQNSTAADGAMFGTTRQTVANTYMTTGARVAVFYPVDGSVYDAVVVTVAIFR